MTTYVNVRVHRLSIHKTCMRCNQPATVTSKSVAGATKMEGWYCRDHAVEGTIIKEDSR